MNKVSKIVKLDGKGGSNALSEYKNGGDVSIITMKNRHKSTERAASRGTQRPSSIVDQVAMYKNKANTQANSHEDLKSTVSKASSYVKDVYL